MRWIALAVLATVGATMLLTWPNVEEESGLEKAHSLYGFSCPAACELGPSYVAFRVNQLFATEITPGEWSRKRVERTPATGAIAVYDDDRVAFVERVLAPGAIEISELSADRLTRRTVTRGDGWPNGFIHVVRVAPDAPVVEPGSLRDS